MLEPVEDKMHLKAIAQSFVGLWLSLIVIGAIFKQPSGAVAAALSVFIAGFVVRRAFQWSPDPHAKRKFLFLALAIFAGGLAGAVVVDIMTTEILIRMGRCPRSVGCF